MNLYLNNISRTEVYFGHLSDDAAEELRLKNVNCARAGDIVMALEMLLDALLARTPQNEEQILFVRLYLEACKKFPDAVVSCD